MAYTPNPTWQDYPSVATLVTATTLNRIESGVVNAALVADTATSTKASLLIPTAVKVAAYTAAVGDLALMNVAGGATTLTLPTAPVDKSQVAFQAIGATSAVPLVVNPGAGDTLTLASATTLSIPLADEVVMLQYLSTPKQWIFVSDVKTLASLTPAALGAAAAVHTHLTPWALEAILYGFTRSTAVSDLPEGLRINSARTLTQVFHRFGTADNSGTTTINSYLNGTLIAGSAVSIVAPAVVGNTGTISIALAAGDILTHRITAVGGAPGVRLTTQAVGTQLCT